jgi:opacity protein-like surface antigen
MKSRSILIAAAVLLALSAPSAAAKDARWVLDFENGAAFSGYNNIAVPGDTGTRFSLSKDFKTDAAYFSASGVSPFPIYFYGTDFPEGAPVKGSYKFNSYRLTYRYELVRGGKWKVGVGFTAKIRDAAIGLESGALSATRKNVGPVPLLNVHIERWLSPKAGLLLDADALAAPQGRAEDVLLAIMVRISPSMTLRAGYRFVEGGADNDKVYTFALIHYASVGISIDL